MAESRGYEAISTITVEAPRSAVWAALVEPDLVIQYMHGTQLETDWKVGSPITWSGEWKGKSYQDKGTVPGGPAGTAAEVHPLEPDGWQRGHARQLPHRDLCDLAEVGGQTELTLTQDNNPTQADADSMARSNWGPMLQGLKETAETTNG